MVASLDYLSDKFQLHCVKVLNWNKDGFTGMRLFIACEDLSRKLHFLDTVFIFQVIQRIFHVEHPLSLNTTGQKV